VLRKPINLEGCLLAYHSFENLEVWQSACRFTVNLYRGLEGWRDFGLKDQMTRAAVSIASNIAEGAERGSDAEFVRFLHISKGSAAELRTQVYIATRIGLLEESLSQQFIEDLKQISIKLHALIKSLKPKT